MTEEELYDWLFKITEVAEKEFFDLNGNELTNSQCFAGGWGTCIQLLGEMKEKETEKFNMLFGIEED